MDTEKLSKVIDLFHKFAMDTEADSSLLDGDVPTEDTVFEESLNVDESPISEPESTIDFSKLNDEQLATLIDSSLVEQKQRSMENSEPAVEPEGEEEVVEPEGEEVAPDVFSESDAAVLDAPEVNLDEATSDLDLF